VASLPRLPIPVEHRVLKWACSLPPRAQRLLFGAPPTIDGQTLASDIHAMLCMAHMAGNRSLTEGRPPEAARRMNRHDAAVAQGTRPIQMARLEELSIPGPAGPLRARHYLPYGLPAGLPAPLLVFFHGGGWVIGDLDTHDGVCRFFAAVAGVQVLSVEYRLSPEHPFPEPVEDAWAAYLWAVENAATLGADPSRIAVGGDSAGGNMTGVISILSREEGGPSPAMQLLLYPVTDTARDTPSRRLFAEGFLLTRPDMEQFEGYYLPSGTDYADPRISILNQRDLGGLPPAFVATAGFDPLRDEGEAFALKMREAGTKVALRRYPGLIHAFANEIAVSRSARTAMLEIAGALRMGLA
jgi:acetyl esterase/lipase